MPKRSLTRRQTKTAPPPKLPAKPPATSRNKSTAQIAELLDLDPATVLRWCADGLPHTKPINRKAGNLYDVDEVRGWMSKFGRTGAVGRPAEEGTEEFATWHTRKEKALALKRERENSVEEGKLIDAETERRRDVQKLTVFRNRLCGLGASLSPQMEGLDGAGRQALIDKAIEDALNFLAEQ